MVPSLQVRKLGPVGQMAQVTGIMRAVVLCASFPLPSASRVAPGTDQALGDYPQHEGSHQGA